MGLTGDLHYSEILEQVVHAERILAQDALERITQQQQNPLQEEEESSEKKKNKKKHGVASDLEVVRNIVFMGTYFLVLLVVGFLFVFAVWSTRNV